MALCGCGGAEPLVVAGAPVAEGFVLESPELLRSDDDLRRLAPPVAVAGESIYALVEIPAGTTAKWQVRHSDGALEWERDDDGRRRVVDYLGYPANYGIVPSTELSAEMGGDGDPLDVLVLGPALPRGTLIRARPVAVFRLVDDGERDDKIIAVPLEGAFARVDSLPALERAYPGVTTILETWLTSYDAEAELESHGWAGADAAWEAIAAAKR